MGNFFKDNPLGGLLMGPVAGSIVQGEKSPWQQMLPMLGGLGGALMGAGMNKQHRGRGALMGGLAGLGMGHAFQSHPMHNQGFGMSPEAQAYWQNEFMNRNQPRPMGGQM